MEIVIIQSKRKTVAAVSADLFTAIHFHTNKHHCYHSFILVSLFFSRSIAVHQRSRIGEDKEQQTMLQAELQQVTLTTV